MINEVVMEEDQINKLINFSLLKTKMLRLRLKKDNYKPIIINFTQKLKKEINHRLACIGFFSDAEVCVI